LSQFTLGVVSADNPLLVALVVALIVLFFNPARSYLRRIIDNAMFRQRHNYRERIDRFSRKISDVVNMTDVMEKLQEELGQTVAPRDVFLFTYDSRSRSYVPLPQSNISRATTDITFPAGGGLVKYLTEEQSVLYLTVGQPLPITAAKDRSRLGVLNTPLLMRLQGRDRLHGILALGTRRSSETYTYEDLRYVESLVDQVALAVERAQFVDDLEHRVRIQDVLSQVSRALNFAIDFDTLQELLYAQTIRILDADHFFITLYDHLSNELHFTFYSLGDERLEDIEGIRWKMGKDVISQVAAGQRPLRVEHYTQEQIEHNPAYVNNELPGIHAWMGAPLMSDTTGAGLLGVIAIGYSEPNLSYTDEQLELLHDIASIAASAIDKTQLFQKTELRAAQLKALNDISSQLASELEDVGRLLETITENAVKILGCEAGSLVLVDESSRDLVFRVVTGGGGEELLGTHIRRDQPSLVADAVKRMEPLIVNDPRSDARWHGEVGDEDLEETGNKKGFHSRTILTVPLVAQGEAVGALQVINKRDGSPFSDEDAILATTFAGQAAIAIQNARLFESQDKQLLLRVQELEGMAAIDHSLNQTLIIDQLVDLVMEWALRRTGARHG
ncbi:MAG TPA: GAF domain-containing protein, partial [Aggregatilineales bacterium]|nr:GAF domain-containing protein [Aggregatilineales bacterium]